MKEIKFTCDQCGNDITNKPRIELGSCDGKSFRMNNSLDNAIRVGMDQYTNIHFCSEKCFSKFFFKEVESAQKKQ